MASSPPATWRFTAPLQDSSYDGVFDTVREALTGAFATTHSLALQQTIHAMGTAALDACPEIAEIRISCPNKHHFLVDLDPFGLDNPGEVYLAADRPYGLISATLARAGAAAEPRAWVGIAG